MKKYVILTILIIGSINIFAQGEGKYNYLEVVHDLDVGGDVTVNDSSLKLLIETHSSSATNTASDGIEKVGNNFQLGGEFTQDVETDGAGYTYGIGNSTSKLGRFEIYSNDDVYFSADDKFIVEATGITWTCNGYYWISSNSDTLMTNDLVDAKILASDQYLPFNFEFNYSTTLTDSRPGVSYFRLNNQVYSSATQIYIDYFDNNSTDKSDFLSLPDTGSFVTISDGINYINYKLTGGITPASSYYKYNVTYQNNSGVISGLCTISINISNSTGVGGGGGGSTDSLYYAYTGEWLVGGDTIPDSTTYSDNANIANFAIESLDSSFVEATINKLIAGTSGDTTIIDTDGTISQYNTGAKVFSTNSNGIVESASIIRSYQDASNFASMNSSYFQMNRVGVRRLDLKPSESDGVGNTTYLFDTENDIVSGSIADFKVQGVTQTSITKGGVVTNAVIVDGDSITGKTDAKTYIESESFDSIVIGSKSIKYDAVEYTHLHKLGLGDIHAASDFEDYINIMNGSLDTIKYGEPVSYNGLRTAEVSSSLPASARAHFGLAAMDIPPGEEGAIKVRGFLANVPGLSGLTGLTIYVSPDSALIDTQPGPPNDVVVAGIRVGTDSMYVFPSQELRRLLKSNSYSFTSQGVGAGTFWKAGFYDFPTTDANLTQAATSIAYGTVDIAYEAHPFAVYGGVGSVTGGGRVALITTGTSYNDVTGTQTASDVDTIINDITNAVLNAYDETKKYLGTVTYSLVVVEGAPSAYSLDFNYGYAKYDDNNDEDFYITAFESHWRGDGTDATGFDIEFLKHTQTGWTYAATGFDAGNGIIAQRSVDQAGFLRVVNNTESSWKRSSLGEYINGAGEEGYLIRLTTANTSTIQTIDMHVETEIIIE